LDSARKNDQREKRSMTMDAASLLYLELMKKCLTNTIYPAELVPINPKSFYKRQIVRLFGKRGITLARERPADFENRAKGLDNNPRAHTMIGLRRLTNIQTCVQQAIDDNVPGDLIEAGVWRGGATAFMRAILKANAILDRLVWVADSFAGLPSPDQQRYPQDSGDLHHTLQWLAVSLDEVKETFRKYDLLDEHVRFLKGRFKDTLPRADIKRLAVIRLDGDMYESTMDSLTSLYPKLSIGGYIILDDWGILPSCRGAIDDYRSSQGISEPVLPVDEIAGYWRRER
jgi:hypothetical protein